MSTQNSDTKYMLLFRGNDWHKGLSAEQTQEVANQFMAWFNRLSQHGTVLAGNPLEAEGKVVSGKGGRVVADGPFAESKEAIGGYFLVQADSLEEAVAIAKDCPALAYGTKVEVRPVAEKCPLTGASLPERELAQASA